MRRWLVLICLGIAWLRATPPVFAESKAPIQPSMDRLEANLAEARAALTAELNLSDDYKNARQQLDNAQAALDALPPDCLAEVNASYGFAAPGVVSWTETNCTSASPSVRKTESW